MQNKKKYDVVIVGGGVSGTALLYVLTNFTNLKRIALIEKYPLVAQVSSNPKMNSQTLHFGDIETNYTLEKAKKVKASSELVRNYLLRYDKGKRIYTKYHKMALAVGDEECRELDARIKEFKKVYPKIKRLGRKQIEKIEPKIVEGRDKDEKLLALYSDDGYAIDFQMLSESFLENSVKNKNGTTVDIYLKTRVSKITKEDDDYIISAGEHQFLAKVPIFATGTYSLGFARSLGYGMDVGILPVAGNFYVAKEKLLNGKVYRIQNKKLPFAAVHGDPEVHDSRTTRFGPTAKLLFMMEKNNYMSIIDYFKYSGLDFKGFLIAPTILTDKVMAKYMSKNLLYDIPFLGKIFFAMEIRKIIPSIKASMIKKARGYGGIRPQIINVKKASLELGESKIIGDNVIFNITPSPGASRCLGNALDDTRMIVKFLGKKYRFDEKKLMRELG